MKSTSPDLNKYAYGGVVANRKWREVQAVRWSVKALCSRRMYRLNLSFSAPFYGPFFGRTKNEQNVRIVEYYHKKFLNLLSGRIKITR
jgi:hypothetical protein